jgi:hypothetical protein
MGNGSAEAKAAFLSSTMPSRADSAGDIAVRARGRVGAIEECLTARRGKRGTTRSRSGERSGALPSLHSATEGSAVEG